MYARWSVHTSNCVDSYTGLTLVYVCRPKMHAIAVFRSNQAVISKVHRAHRIPVPKLQTRFRQWGLRHWAPARSAGRLQWQTPLSSAIAESQRLHQQLQQPPNAGLLACTPVNQRHTCHCIRTACKQVNIIRTAVSLYVLLAHCCGCCCDYLRIAR
jgi:hypothetical protein